MMSAEQLEHDKKELKRLRQELIWKMSACDRIELAIEFGRCKKCGEPVMVEGEEHCGDYPQCEVPKNFELTGIFE